MKEELLKLSMEELVEMLEKNTWEKQCEISRPGIQNLNENNKSYSFSSV